MTTEFVNRSLVVMAPRMAIAVLRVDRTQLY
jgi:hypothetical protein